MQSFALSTQEYVLNGPFDTQYYPWCKCPTVDELYQWGNGKIKQKESRIPELLLPSSPSAHDPLKQMEQ